MTKTALVTGASRGIGAATAKALAADGYRVIVHYGANREKAEQVAADIRAAGGDAQIVGGDLANPAAPQALAAEVAALCGGRLDALVLNAGIMPGDSSFTNCSPETFDAIYTVNLRAPFFLIQHLAPVLADGASVVLLSSVTARHAIGAVAAYGSM
ncbi:MAG: short-chain dehydrogenase/reductase [Novosphingobium sp.]|nr:short-chain dehydrogenase/reductase [Novosphingobium sp.]